MWWGHWDNSANNTRCKKDIEAIINNVRIDDDFSIFPRRLDANKRSLSFIHQQWSETGGKNYLNLSLATADWRYECLKLSDYCARRKKKRNGRVKSDWIVERNWVNNRFMVILPRRRYERLFFYRERRLPIIKSISRAYLHQIHSFSLSLLLLLSNSEPFFFVWYVKNKLCRNYSAIYIHYLSLSLSRSLARESELHNGRSSSRSERKKRSLFIKSSSRNDLKRHCILISLTRTNDVERLMWDLLKNCKFYDSEVFSLSLINMKIRSKKVLMK